MPQKIPGVWGAGPHGTCDRSAHKKGIQKCRLNQLLTRTKTVAVPLTTGGARVGDIFMSLIYTCQLSGANPFDYLTELARHADQLASNPKYWMPWNYRSMLDAATPVPDAAR